MTVIKEYSKTVFVSDGMETLCFMLGFIALICFIFSMLAWVDSMIVVVIVTLVLTIATGVGSFYTYRTKTFEEIRKDVVFDEGMTIGEIESKYTVRSVEWPVFTIKELEIK